MGADHSVVFFGLQKFIKRIAALNHKLVNKGFISVLRGMIFLKTVAYAEKLREFSVYQNMPLAYQLGFFGRPKGKRILYIAFVIIRKKILSYRFGGGSYALRRCCRIISAIALFLYFSP